MRGICLDVNDCIGAEGPMGLTLPAIYRWPRQQNIFKVWEAHKKIEDLPFAPVALDRYTGISNIRMLDKEYCKNEAVKVACESLAYQVAKWIGPLHWY